MNTPVAQTSSRLPLDVPDELAQAVLLRFNREAIQYLSPTDLLQAQSLAGHGDVWGVWQTPKSLSPGKIRQILRSIDIAGRIKNFLIKKEDIPHPDDGLLDEAVRALVRLALLTRLTRSGSTDKSQLKPSSIIHRVYYSWPRIAARAMKRRASEPDATGLFSGLTASDIQELSTDPKYGYRYSAELDRIRNLVTLGCWTDAPPLPDVQQITDPSQAVKRSTQKKSIPHAPFPDDWLVEIGPRVLWVVQDLGPNLLRLLEDLRDGFKDIDVTRSSFYVRTRLRERIQTALQCRPWLDANKKPLTPPFQLITGAGIHGADTAEWPPRTWEQVTTMAVTLQAAHLFIALLACAGRIGEVATLERNNVDIARDGKDYLHGTTYKLSGNLFGDERQWPAPEILKQSIGQQARLVEAMSWLPESIEKGLPDKARFGEALWVSISVRGKAGKDAEFDFGFALTALARRLGVDSHPGGIRVHAHRFRKTVGRLAGVALFNSPLVLKRLFGHKSIEMTLHYILSDPAVRAEAEKVLRELRIMHCADALQKIREAIADGRPLPGHGGPGAVRLINAVETKTEQLAQSGRIWDEGSAYDLAYLLTAQGQGWRLIKPDIICSKAPGEDGLCQKKRSKGEPDTSNCKPECVNRIVLETRRRDVQSNVAQYVDIARQAREYGQLLVLAHAMENARSEWLDFPDLAKKYEADPEVQALFALCDEDEEESLIEIEEVV